MCFKTIRKLVPWTGLSKFADILFSWTKTTLLKSAINLGKTRVRHPLVLLLCKIRLFRTSCLTKSEQAPSLQTLFVAFKCVKSALEFSSHLATFAKRTMHKYKAADPLCLRGAAHILLRPAERASRNISPISHCRSDLLHFGISAAVCSHLRPGTMTAVLGAYLPH